MKLLASTFSRLDAAVQRRFDSVCFFLMRRFGLRKSTIRYGLHAVAVIGIAAIAVHFASIGQAALAVVISVFLLLLLILQQGTLMLDRDAEGRPGTRSAADAFRYRGRDKLYAVITIILAPIIISVFPRHALALLGLIHFDLAELLLMYLAKTPLNPPAEKVWESAFLPQTAPAKL